MFYQPLHDHNTNTVTEWEYSVGLQTSCNKWLTITIVNFFILCFTMAEFRWFQEQGRKHEFMYIWLRQRQTAQHTDQPGTRGRGRGRRNRRASAAAATRKSQLAAVCFENSAVVDCVGHLYWTSVWRSLLRLICLGVCVHQHSHREGEQEGIVERLFCVQWKLWTIARDYNSRTVAPQKTTASVMRK